MFGVLLQIILLTPELCVSNCIQYLDNAKLTSRWIKLLIRSRTNQPLQLSDYYGLESKHACSTICTHNKTKSLSWHIQSCVLWLIKWLMQTRKGLLNIMQSSDWLKYKTEQTDADSLVSSAAGWAACKERLSEVFYNKVQSRSHDSCQKTSTGITPSTAKTNTLSI